MSIEIWYWNCLYCDGSYETLKDFRAHWDLSHEITGIVMPADPAIR